MGTVKLTQYQERQIREARQRGAGYRAIASVIGIDRDTVRNYCKRHSLDSEASANETAARPKTCPNCGRTLQQPRTGRPRRFCSDDCRRAWWSKHQSAIMRSEAALYSTECVACKKVFIAYGNAHRKYCSRECYLRDRFGCKTDNSMINMPPLACNVELFE